VEDGFARFAGPLVDRLFQIEGPSERVNHARDAMIAQIRQRSVVDDQEGVVNGKQRDEQRAMGNES